MAKQYLADLLARHQLLHQAPELLKLKKAVLVRVQFLQLFLDQRLAGSLDVEALEQGLRIVPSNPMGASRNEVEG